MKKLFSLIVFVTMVGCASSILDTKSKELYTVKPAGKDYTIRVVYMPSNATIQSAIQVTKQYAVGKEEILSTYERYNFMDTCKLLNDSTFMLVVRDTVSVLGNKPDTMLIRLK